MIATPSCARAPRAPSATRARYRDLDCCLAALLLAACLGLVAAMGPFDPAERQPQASQAVWAEPGSGCLVPVHRDPVTGRTHRLSRSCASLRPSR